MRLLSIIIPSYNVELYLSRCLDSLLYDDSLADVLDVIIVNDGSSDSTLNTAEKYKKLFPDTITIIDKENGGHGSTVNAGIKVAKGKYLKVIDADDWVNVAEFADFVQELKDINDDIVITNYQRDVLYDSSVIEFNFYQNSDSQKIESIEKLIDREDFFFMFSMHSMTVKTAALKKVWRDGLLEKTFYVDQQYVAKTLMCAKTFRTLDYNIYRYFIGRPEQSVSAGGFFKHRQDHERVLRWLMEELHSEKIQNNEYLKVVIGKQVQAMIGTHYEIYYTAFSATNDEVAELFGFNDYLAKTFPDLHKSISAAQNVRKRLSRPRRIIKRKLLAK